MLQRAKIDALLSGDRSVKAANGGHAAGVRLQIGEQLRSDFVVVADNRGAFRGESRNVELEFDRALGLGAEPKHVIVVHTKVGFGERVNVAGEAADSLEVVAFEDAANRTVPARNELVGELARVAVAGERAGSLTREGALLLDPSGALEAGIPLCPPEGDAGTGMVATNSVLPRTGNVSVGTSVFGMIVLERELSRVYREIDLVTTPAGDPVAMVHCNNGTSDIDTWINLIRDCMRVYGLEPDERTLYQSLFRSALEGEADCGGLSGCNYLSGEHITDFSSGRPLFARLPDARLNAANFMRTQLFGVFASLRIGMDILTDGESVKIDNLNGHGGFFRVEGVGQRIMAAALCTPVTVMETAGDGGPWGMALLAAYMAQKSGGETLADYLATRVFADSKRATVVPDAAEMAGFDSYRARFSKLLDAERAALEIR